MSESSSSQEKVVKKEGKFQDFADWVSAAMGRPTNIIFWFVLVLAWTLVFAFGSPHIASGIWLPKWFTSQGYNFPLNLITTVAELFIGFLCAAASNRVQEATTTLLNKIQKETDQIDRLLKENTELTKIIHDHILNSK